jgi:hypothetical protein
MPARTWLQHNLCLHEQIEGLFILAQDLNLAPKKFENNLTEFDTSHNTHNYYCLSTEQIDIHHNFSTSNEQTKDELRNAWCS